MSDWDEHVAKLARAGRVRNTFDKKQVAREWNGKSDNIESIYRCREGGVVNQPAHVRAGPPRTVPTSSAAPLYPLVTLCRSMKLPEPTPEYRFHPQRRWRFDYAFPLHALAVEVEGGLWTNGRHSRGSGAIADLEKYSEAAILGWRIIYCTPQEMHNGVALDRIMRALTDREAA